MADTGVIPDYLAALDRALRGPAKVKAALLAEAADGLYDTVSAYRDAGLSPADAAGRAVDEFGPVPVLVPSYQRELSLEYARRTAVMVLWGLPFLLVLWHVAWVTSPGKPWVGASLAPVVARVSAVAVTLLVLMVAGALPLTGRASRYVRVGGRLVGIVGWLTTATAVTMAASLAVMVGACPRGAVWPPVPIVGVVTVALLGKLARAGLACQRLATLA
ncbi:MAG: permease prefix domain 1-containing protein [Mycobacteriales bacterium]